MRESTWDESIKQQWGKPNETHIEHKKISSLLMPTKKLPFPLRILLLDFPRGEGHGLSMCGHFQTGKIERAVWSLSPSHSALMASMCELRHGCCWPVISIRQTSNAECEEDIPKSVSEPEGCEAGGSLSPKALCPCTHGCLKFPSRGCFSTKCFWGFWETQRWSDRSTLHWGDWERCGHFVIPVHWSPTTSQR